MLHEGGSIKDTIMRNRVASVLLLAVWLTHPALAQQSSATVKAAVVALTEDTELRDSFERQLVALARTRGYDAVTSYDITRDIRDISDERFVEDLRSRGVQAVLMLRPASVGEGSSLESVRGEVSPRLFADMQRYARRVSDTGPDDLIAVVHLGIYMITSGRPEPISSGAVWLDEPVTDRAEAVERLQLLIANNVDAVRPAIREHLGLEPLR